MKERGTNWIGGCLSRRQRDFHARAAEKQKEERGCRSSRAINRPPLRGLKGGACDRGECGGGQLTKLRTSDFRLLTSEFELRISDFPAVF